MNANHTPSAGWLRRLVVLGVSAAIVVATILRAAPLASPVQTADPARELKPVAAAIGLTRDLPRDAVLSTYVFSLIYAARYQLAVIASPDTSPVDFCAGFLQDPVAFSKMARIAAIEAGVLAVCLLYILVAKIVDPLAGVAAAFLLAVHPTAIAMSHSYGSAVFCLLFLLLGLVVFASAVKRTMRPVDFVAAGLALGFATETMPMSWLLLVALLSWMIHQAPAEQRRKVTTGAALCAVAFVTAALTVLPGSDLARLDAVLATAMSAAIGLAVVAAGVTALRGIRQRMPRRAYPSVVLGGALLTSLALISEPGMSRAAPGDDPCVAASRWMARSLPTADSVAVHLTLRDRISIPRSAASWRRELDAPAELRQCSRAYAATAMHAADVLAGQAWDVVYVTGPGHSAHAFRDLNGDVVAAAYLVVPSDMDLTQYRWPSAGDGLGLWLVARFLPERGSGEGVAIWGFAQAATPLPPIQVNFDIGMAHRIACLERPGHSG